jgi:hypothetical protein
MNENSLKKLKIKKPCKIQKICSMNVCKSNSGLYFEKNSI